MRPRPDALAGPNLAPSSNGVHAVQLYRATDAEAEAVRSGTAAVEARLPILPLRRASASDPGPTSGDENAPRLQLKFDLLEGEGRPLSIYFYHADRTWQRDLVPSRYLESFLNDNLIRYTPSRATEVPYVHYEYAFPNESIGFTVSGNYVLRVTEQGREEEVLFERAFFVTEQAVPLEVGFDAVLTSGRGFSSVQPVAFFRPPAQIVGSPYDFNVCFVRNGRVERARCSDRPSLNQQPTLAFQLQPQTAFEPLPADYFLDLGALQLSNQIARVDLSADPYEVVLEPDYARFGGEPEVPFIDGGPVLLNGQPIIAGAVRDVAEPDLAAQYVRVRFQYVPPEEQPLGGEVLVTGAFNNWQYDPANTLQWVPERGRYEGDVLLKQGQYEYRYATTDREAYRALAGTLPRRDNLYTALVYYADIELGTDRLLAVQEAIAR